MEESMIKIIEWILIGILICFQVYMFFVTREKIIAYKASIPDSDNLEIVNYYQEVDEEDEADEDLPMIKQVEEKNKNPNPKNSFQAIQTALNKYLSRNRENVVDFNLMKDIVERHTDAREEEIHLTISVPLYLGLAGTMIGIVLSLFGIDTKEIAKNIGSDSGISEGIAVLLDGVKIAMVASFIGLLLTIINSAFIFKDARRRVDRLKNNFYTFLQTELLPDVNKNLSSMFSILQQNLSQFNATFKTNFSGLSEIFKGSRETLEAQRDILSILENINMKEMYKANAQIFMKLQDSLAEFNRFNEHFSGLNKNIDISYQLSEKLSNILERTENFYAIAEQVDTNTKDNKALINFLSQHFRQLELYKEKMNEHVAQVTDEINKTTDDLKADVEAKRKILQQHATEEVFHLRDALEESRADFKSLSHLASIDSGITSVAQANKDTSEHIEVLSEKMDLLYEQMAQSVACLQALEGIAKRRYRPWWIKLLHFFGIKKNTTRAKKPMTKKRVLKNKS